MATNTAVTSTTPSILSSPNEKGPYSIGFVYVNQSDVEVYVNGVKKSITTDYTFSSATQITFVANPTVSIEFRRNSDLTARSVDFNDGSVLTESDLDSNTNQILYAQQEIINDVATKTGTETLTNKTLTTPDINTPDIDGGTIDGATISSCTINNNVTGALTGNASTATTLQNARTIGGVSFDGSANINLAGVNTSGTQDTSGNAATATQLETARTIGGVSFNGTSNINLPGVNATGNQNTSGSAATLTTPRNINGTAFNGSADITITAAGNTLTGNTLASGVTASSLTSVGTLAGLNVDGNIDISNGEIKLGNGDEFVLKYDETNNRANIVTDSLRFDSSSGSLNVYFANNLELAISGFGIQLSDRVYPETNNAIDLGWEDAGKRFRNISAEGIGKFGSLNITGNITVGGTVDGRDVATDGSKLDGIDTGAKDDQTAAEIKTLLDSSGLVNNQIDASAAIAGSKISPVFTSNTTIQTTHPKLFLTDSNSDSDFSLENANGVYRIYDQTHSASRLEIASDGTVDVIGNLDVGAGIDVTGDISVTGDIKVGTAAGTANQYLKKSSSNELAWETVSPGAAGGANTIHMNDSVKLTFGDSTTPDLEIYHDENHSYIQDEGTGNLYIDANQFYLRQASDDTVLIQTTSAGKTVIKYNGSASASIETTSTGGKVTGDTLQVSGSGHTKLQIETTGTGHATGIQIKHASGNAAEQTWQIQTDGSADGDLKLRNATAGTDAIVVDPSNNASFAGDITVSTTKPTITLNDTNSESDYIVQNDDGVFAITDIDNAVGRITIAPNGQTNINGNCDFNNGIDVTGAATFAGDVNLANTKTIKFPGAGVDAGATIKHQSGNFEINNDTGNTYFDTTGSHYLRTNGSTTALTLDNSQNATFTGAVSVASKTVSQTATAVAALEIDCATGNYFTKAITTSSTFTFANVPASGTAYGFVIEIDVTGSSTAITWPAAVKWPGGTAPTLTDTKTHVFTFATVDGGTTWRASSLVDYTT